MQLIKYCSNFVLAVLVFLVAISQVAPSASAMTKLQLRDAMNKLWEDHVTWTRLYIISAAADLPDKDPTAQRLLQNQVDIGNAIKPFYGDAAGEKLNTTASFGAV